METNEILQPFYIRIEFPILSWDGPNPRVSRILSTFAKDLPVCIWIQVGATVKSDVMNRLGVDVVESALFISTYRYINNIAFPIAASSPITYKYARKNGMRFDNLLVLDDVVDVQSLRTHFVGIFVKSVQLGNTVKNLPWNIMGVSWFRLFNKIDNIPPYLITRK